MKLRIISSSMTASATVLLHTQVDGSLVDSSVETLPANA